MGKRKTILTIATALLAVGVVVGWCFNAHSLKWRVAGAVMAIPVCFLALWLIWPKKRYMRCLRATCSGKVDFSETIIVDCVEPESVGCACRRCGKIYGKKSGRPLHNDQFQPLYFKDGGVKTATIIADPV